MNAILRARVMNMLKVDEGLRLRVYDDATGKPLKPGDQLKGQPTIGYGRNLAQVGINVDEAEALLDTDVALLERTLPRRLDWLETLDEPRQAVLYNMAFNMGVSGLLRFSEMLAACKRRDFETAAVEMRASIWYGKTGPRAKRLIKMMQSGQWPEGTKVPIPASAVLEKIMEDDKELRQEVRRKVARLEAAARRRET